MTVWQYRKATGYGKKRPTDEQLDTLEKRIANTKADLDAQRSRAKDVDELADVEADSG